MYLGKRKSKTSFRDDSPVRYINWFFVWVGYLNIFVYILRPILFMRRAVLRIRTRTWSGEWKRISVRRRPPSSSSFWVSSQFLNKGGDPGVPLNSACKSDSTSTLNSGKNYSTDLEKGLQTTKRNDEIVRSKDMSIRGRSPFRLQVVTTVICRHIALSICFVKKKS